MRNFILKSTCARVFATVGALFVAIGTSQAQSPTGNYRGEWVSMANGHRGPIKATVQQTSPDSVVVRFRGRFAKVIPFAYTSRLAVTSSGPEGTQVAGSQKLPIFGQFSTTGTIQGDRFDARFQSARGDAGEFRMIRSR